MAAFDPKRRAACVWVGSDHGWTTSLGRPIFAPIRSDEGVLGMKGMIFNELQRLVTERRGEDAWDELIERTPLENRDGLFVGPKTYPDADFLALVSSASAALGTPVTDLVRDFGKFMFPHLAERYPVFMKPGMTAKTFLLSVERTIHVEVRKLYPDAVLPAFEYSDPAPARLNMTYRSPRRLCALVLGLVDGVADHFQEDITCLHTTCVHRGDESCRFELTFRPRAPAR